jgi:hypothetical protein
MPTNTPPPPREGSKKGEPPARVEARGNLSKPEPGKMVALNFRVPAEVKKDFKIAAAVAGITQSELLQRAFSEWKQRNG